MNESKPLAYGYMRVTNDTSDDAIWQAEQGMEDYAEAHGMQYAGVFHEFTNGSHSAWNTLLAELQRAEAHHIIMPALEHLSRHSLLMRCLLDRAEYDAKAEVHELGDRQWMRAAMPLSES